ncbi:ribonuclease III [Roseibacillus ishigakijimensis]|uniref:Ribonuclease 3 n=1 Tax=Roseibacillus ishigakijimensis TaxID=454146 RepID=A0A934VL52_9BACT|nr:ribonuclease III [Roseibacillus ishigakijimensis]MBK1832520.1 ribonuclease III [Roseibacillus ishigakijimensis]
MSIESNLSYHFRDRLLLTTALTHPSLTAESKEEITDNQRLEFLGDAVLQLTVTEELYRRFPEEGEGTLTKWRARLVSKPALAEFGNKLELGQALRMGKGEAASGGRERPSSLADCVEALLGAVYLDGGFEAARQVVLGLIEGAFETVTQSSASGNPKGDLQEILQAIAPANPVYEILSVTGPDHDRHFKAVVTWNDLTLGHGAGSSKKLAEAAAAADALKTQKWTTQP